MKKSIFVIALTAIALMASSAFNDSAVGTDIGKYAPQMTLGNDSATLSLDDCRGGYVVLTFWSASDALSRQQCNRYAAWTGDIDKDNVRHIAVNLDQDRRIFDEVVRLDGMDGKAQFNVQGEVASRIIKDYRLEGGLGSVLINPDGRIGKINPSLSDLQSL